MRSGGWWLLTLLSVGSSGLAGCASPMASLPADIGGTAWLDGSARVVVATLLDTGVQPYHEAFRLGNISRAGWIRSLPQVTILDDTFRNEVTRDPERWSSLELGRLYWFEGTRVLAISFWRPSESTFAPVAPLLDELTGETNRYPVLDEAGHGTAVASVVAQASPHAFILMVEDNGEAEDSFQWLSSQTWVDIYSVSRASAAGASVATFDPEGRALRAAAQAGHLVFVGSGNDPSPLFTAANGAPWVVRVGGADADAGGATIMAGGIPDVVANFTHSHAARHDDSAAYREVSGTSFSAPRAAGVVAEAIYEARTVARHEGGLRDGALVDSQGLRLMHADFRAALNATAFYWSPTAYQAPDPSTAATRPGRTALPLMPSLDPAPVGPWMQAGWGFVDESLTPRIVQGVVSGDLPPKPSGATLFMEAVYAARTAYWENGD